MDPIDPVAFAAELISCPSVTPARGEVFDRLVALLTESKANFRVIECICSDEALHRARLTGRQRGIPGWYELDWAEVERIRAEYEPWSDEHLTVDMVRPFDDNLAAVLAYLRPA